MIDTIHLNLLRKNAGKNFDWNIDKMVLNLDNIRTSEYNGEISKTGTLNNMRVKITDDYISVKGSLPRFFFHTNNLQVLTNEEIVEAIEGLSIELELPMERAYIKRLDIARNIVVSKKVESYLNSFTETNGYYSDTTDGSKLYKKHNKQVSISIYDKIKELKKHNKEFYKYNRDGFLKDKNVLRFEVKIEQRLNKVLGYGSVKAVLFRSTKFLNALNKFWYDKFFELSTKGTFEFNTDITTVKELKEQIFYAGIDSLGVEGLYNLLDYLLKEKVITPQVKYKCKQAIDPTKHEDMKLKQLDHAIELRSHMNFLYENLEKDPFYNLNALLKQSYDVPKE